MEVLVKFLDAMQVLLLAKVAILSILALGLFALGVHKGKTWLVVLAVVLGPGQFVLPMVLNTGKLHSVKARVKEIAAMERSLLPANYPRVLAVQGDMPDDLPEDLLILGKVDRIAVLDSPEHGSGQVVQTYSLTRQDPACRSALRAKWLSLNGRDFFKAAPDAAATRAAITTRRSCISQTFGGTPLPGRYLLLSQNGRASRSEHSRMGSSNAVQLDLIEPGKQTLIEFVEIPLVQVSSSATELLPEEAWTYPCDELDVTQILLNAFDAAREPARAAELRNRPGYLIYCITTPDPVDPKDEKDARQAFEKLQLMRLRGSNPWYIAETASN